MWFHVLYQLLGLDVGHAVHTGDTITTQPKLVTMTKITPMLYTK